MTTIFKELKNGLNEIEHISGETNDYKVSAPKDVDVKALRARLNVTPSRKDQRIVEG